MGGGAYGGSGVDLVMGTTGRVGTGVVEGLLRSPLSRLKTLGGVSKQEVVKVKVWFYVD